MNISARSSGESSLGASDGEKQHQTNPIRQRPHLRIASRLHRYRRLIPAPQVPNVNIARDPHDPSREDC